ncbi:2-acylglycerol O-acyltransferase 1 isoform X2 [Eublepharis macularius]|uniref:2-acylglycerol O-acyltransferase 1 n=1 Tax=Eublepharis macularius TaxID=481883 RepID=A0AA97JL18_EUBMA|nr:2-acylglycerol O-acyltransferase 1 isoform X2 [Eublepharis macularius]
MKVEFAPLNVPWRRRAQTAAVAQWVFGFLALAQLCCGIFVILLLGDYWFISVFYALWLYIDWETPQTGGRRSEWVRKWVVWKYFKEYFPIKLVKTSDLDPRQNYLFGFHPHGVLVAGAFGNFCTECTGFKKLFPGMTPYLHTLSFWFRCPFLRDYFMCAGLVSASKKSVSHVLSNEKGGNIAVIVIGGAGESLEARPGSLTLNILKKKGFIKIALKHGLRSWNAASFQNSQWKTECSSGLAWYKAASYAPMTAHYKKNRTLIQDVNWEPEEITFELNGMYTDVQNSN